MEGPNEGGGDDEGSLSRFESDELIDPEDEQKQIKKSTTKKVVEFSGADSHFIKGIRKGKGEIDFHLDPDNSIVYVGMIKLVDDEDANDCIMPYEHCASWLSYFRDYCSEVEGISSLYLEIDAVTLKVDAKAALLRIMENDLFIPGESTVARTYTFIEPWHQNGVLVKAPYGKYNTPSIESLYNLVLIMNKVVQLVLKHRELNSEDGNVMNSQLMDIVYSGLILYDLNSRMHIELMNMSVKNFLLLCRDDPKRFSYLLLKKNSPFLILAHQVILHATTPNHSLIDILIADKSSAYQMIYRMAEAAAVQKIPKNKEFQRYCDILISYAITKPIHLDAEDALSFHDEDESEGTQPEENDLISVNV